MGRLSWSDLSSSGKFTLPFVSKLFLVVYWIFAVGLFIEQLLELLLHTEYIYRLDVAWSFVVLTIQIAVCTFFSWDAVTTENKYELYAFLLSTSFITLRIAFEYCELLPTPRELHVPARALHLCST